MDMVMQLEATWYEGRLMADMGTVNEWSAYWCLEGPGAVVTVG